METLAERLRYYREKTGLKQKEVADIIGVSVAAYNKYETRGNEPKIDILIKLSHVFGVDLNTLCGYQKPAAEIFKNVKKTLEPFSIIADIHPAFNDSIDYDTPVTLTTTLSEADNWLQPFYEHVHNAPLPLFDVDIAIQQAKSETLAAYSAVSKAFFNQRLQNYLFVKPTIDALNPDSVAAYYQKLADKISLEHLQILKQYMELRQAGLEDFKIKKMFDEMYGDDKKEQPPHGTPIPGNGSE